MPEQLKRDVFRTLRRAHTVDDVTDLLIGETGNVSPEFLSSIEQ